MVSDNFVYIQVIFINELMLPSHNAKIITLILQLKTINKHQRYCLLQLYPLLEILLQAKINPSSSYNHIRTCFPTHKSDLALPMFSHQSD